MNSLSGTMPTGSSTWQSSSGGTAPGNGGLSISEFLEKIDLVNFADPSGITSDKSNGYDDESQQMGQTGQQQPPEKQSNTSHADGSKEPLWSAWGHPNGVPGGTPTSDPAFLGPRGLWKNPITVLPPSPGSDPSSGSSTDQTAFRGLLQSAANMADLRIRQDLLMKQAAAAHHHHQQQQQQQQGSHKHGYQGPSQFSQTSSNGWDGGHFAQYSGSHLANIGQHPHNNNTQHQNVLNQGLQQSSGLASHQVSNDHLNGMIQANSGVISQQPPPGGHTPTSMQQQHLVSPSSTNEVNGQAKPVSLIPHPQHSSAENMQANTSSSLNGYNNGCYNSHSSGQNGSRVDGSSPPNTNPPTINGNQNITTTNTTPIHSPKSEYSIPNSASMPNITQDQERHDLFKRPKLEPLGDDGSGLDPTGRVSDSDISLATVPGREFNPARRSFSVDELKPQPIIRKRRKKLVPTHEKNDKYWERREKNNMAAKRSREARRLRENQIAMRTAFLEVENSMLQKALDNVEENNEKLRDANSAMKEKLQTLNGSSNNSTACASSLSSTSSPDQQA